MAGTMHAAELTRVAGALALIGVALWPASRCDSQTLPPHRDLRILVVSDEVNPHALPPAQLTQPGEVSAALLSAPALNLAADPDAVREIATDQIEDATAALSIAPGLAGAYDVLVYFAHRIPNQGADPVVRQEAFVAAIDAFLAAGGGVVSFHHGIYRTAGKESMQALLRGEAFNAVAWDTTTGQNVIDVSNGSFVATNGVVYTGSTPYEHVAFSVPSGVYELFNNTPDERYPTLNLLPGPGVVRPLFASNYVQNGSTHILGYEHLRPNWQGAVVVYQPGEYQPNALGPGNNNFQILLNAIVYTANYGRVPLFADSFE